MARLRRLARQLRQCSARARRAHDGALCPVVVGPFARAASASLRSAATADPGPEEVDRPAVDTRVATSAMTDEQNRWTALAAASARGEWNTSNACGAPGSST